jgi:hypothetical protein
MLALRQQQQQLSETCRKRRTQSHTKASKKKGKDLTETDEVGGGVRKVSAVRKLRYRIVCLDQERHECW